MITPFLEKLIKAGRVGEGSRGGRIIGHTKSGEPIYEGHGENPNRQPYPAKPDDGLETVQSMPQRRRTYLPPEGTQHHYADSSNLRAYKNILRGFKQQGVDFQGHITYDAKTDKVIALSPKAKEMALKILQGLKH